jgi:hypothetical protein
MLDKWRTTNRAISNLADLYTQIDMIETEIAFTRRDRIVRMFFTLFDVLCDAFAFSVFVPMASGVFTFDSQVVQAATAALCVRVIENLVNSPMQLAIVRERAITDNAEVSDGHI